MRVCRSLVLLAVFSLSSVVAQNCGPGLTLLKNDNLPAVPSPTQTQISAIILGLCPGEAIGAVFDVSGLGGAVRVDSASVAYLSPPPVTGVTASANLVIHDGITWTSTGRPILGPVVYDLSALGGSVQLRSSGINTFALMSQTAVVTSGTMVVVWQMDFQTPAAGSCASGYTTNFATDATTGLFCTARPRSNLIRTLQSGWEDVTTASVPNALGISIPLCGPFVNGNWIIRACVEPVAGANPLTISYTPPPPASPNSLIFATFDGGAPFAGQTYVAVPSFSANPPGSPLPFDLNDPLATAFLAGDPTVNALFTNFTGVLNASGQGGGIISLPSIDPALLPFTLYTGFATIDGSGTVSGISDAAALLIQ